MKLDSQYINHVYSKFTTSPKNLDIEIFHVYKKGKQMADIYARLFNQYSFKYRAVLTAKFDKQDEDHRKLNETQSYNNLNIIQNFAESDIDNFDIRSQLERQKQIHEIKLTGWRFDKTISMTIQFYKASELNCSRYVNILLSSSARINIEKGHKNCLFALH